LPAGNSNYAVESPSPAPPEHRDRLAGASALWQDRAAGNRRRGTMAKNKEPGDNRRVGAVKTRSQVKNPVTGKWTKRDDKSGKFMDQKADSKPFKGVRKEK
jgi:hypothetical protein